MAQGNGKVNTFEAHGQMVADGSMFVQVRLRHETGAQASDGGWSPAFFTINAVRGNQPPNQRSRLVLTAADAVRFGLNGGSGAELKTIQVLGSAKDALTLPVVCIVGAKDMSTLAVDTLMGVLHIDGPEGSWSWNVVR